MSKYRGYIDEHTGIAKIAPKQGRKQKVRDVSAINAVKDICLNCERPKCNGCPNDDFTIKRRKKKESDKDVY